jgi:type I restriction enzyme S subunit
MSFPRYPKYKESSVEWLGQVPEHWQITRIKHVVPFTTGWTPPTGDSTAYNGDNLWANISDLGPKVIGDTAKRVSDEAINNSRIKPSPEGSLLFSFKLSIGQVSFAGRDMYTNEAIATFLHSPKLDLNFGYYAFPLFLVENAAENIYGARLLNQELIRSATLPLPPLVEQTAIADFLDRETAKIDGLIAEQERLIELLKEKRQAVISHAVTKGLNPDAPMKDSGIEWIGQVPAHWEVMALKRLIAPGTSISYGIVQPGEPLDDGVPFVQTTNMTTGSFDLENLQRTTAEIAALYPRSRLTGGEIILGIRASIGAAHVVPDTLAGCNLSRGVARIVPKQGITSRYLVSFFGTDAVSRYWQLSKQGSTFNEVSIETVRELSICVPPIKEQAEIAEYVATESKRFDTLTAEAQKAIILLQERRSALISAAVTGQIDVRGIDQQKAA